MDYRVLYSVRTLAVGPRCRTYHSGDVLQWPPRQDLSPTRPLPTPTSLCSGLNREGGEGGLVWFLLDPIWGGPGLRPDRVGVSG